MDASATAWRTEELPRGGRVPQLLREHVPEAAHHQADKLWRVGLPRDRVGFREEIALRISWRPDRGRERARRPARLRRMPRLGPRPCDSKILAISAIVSPSGNGERDDERVAARDLVDHFPRASSRDRSDIHRPSAAAPGRSRHNAQPGRSADRGRRRPQPGARRWQAARAGRDLHELRLSPASAVRLLRAQVEPTRRRRRHPSRSARGTTAAFSSAVQVVLQDDGGGRRVELLFSLRQSRSLSARRLSASRLVKRSVRRDDPQRRPRPQPRRRTPARAASRRSPIRRAAWAVRSRSSRCPSSSATSASIAFMTRSDGIRRAGDRRSCSSGRASVRDASLIARPDAPLADIHSQHATAHLQML